MKGIERLSWSEIHNAGIRNSTVLLDMDGVLLAGGDETVNHSILPYVEELVAHNDVIIVSNTIFKNRCERVARAIDSVCAHPFLRKPSVQVMAHISRDPHKPLVVIGDKLHTDGFFGLRIGARTILLTPRLDHSSDPWYAKISYAFDAILAWLLRI